MKLKTCITLFVAVFLSYYSQASTLNQLVSTIEKKLGVKIIYNQRTTDSWSSVYYEYCNDSVELKTYLVILDQEYSKYPPGYFSSIHIKNIVLGKKLSFRKQYRAGIPDPYMYSLYLSIDGAYSDPSPTYLIHVMHHELHHCTEYAMWDDMYYKWNEWAKTNFPSFEYKTGGESAYADLETDWYSMTHPVKGFVNLYSTTGQEEDRCEIMALIMSDRERKFLFQYYDEDEILQQKISLLVNQLNTFFHSTDNFWQKNMSELMEKK